MNKRRTLFSWYFSCARSYVTYTLLVLFAIGAYYSAKTVREFLLDEAIDRLQEIVLKREQKIITTYQQLKKEMTTHATNEGLQEAFTVLMLAYKNKKENPEEYQQQGEAFRSRLFLPLKEWGAEDVLLVNMHNKVVFFQQTTGVFATLTERGVKENLILYRSLQRSRMAMKPDISRLWQDRKNRTASFFISIPVIREKRLQGNIVFHIHDTIISKFLRDYTGLGQTGETILGQRSAQGVLFISPLRFEFNVAFKKTISRQENSALPMAQASKGMQGKGQSLDYRKQSVVAAWRYIQQYDWGLVVKQDRAEILGSFSWLFSLLHVIFYAAIFFMLLFAFPLLCQTKAWFY